MRCAVFSSIVLLSILFGVNSVSAMDLIWEGEGRLASVLEQLVDPNRFDYDSDGIPDVPSASDRDMPTGQDTLRTYSAAGDLLMEGYVTPTSLCSICTMLSGLKWAFAAFAEVDPEAGREVILAWDGSYMGVAIEGVSIFDANMANRVHEFLAPPSFIYDLDGNGTEEIAVHYANGFQVWGYPQDAGLGELGRRAGPALRIDCRPTANPSSAGVVFAIAAKRAAIGEATILDISGRVIRNLGRHELLPGENTLLWDGRNQAGSLVPAGAYFLSLRESNGSTSTMVTLIR